MQVHKGGCLCGAVRYEVTGPLRDVIFCHCSQCRRQTGLYYAATAAATQDLALTSDHALAWYAASDHARRGFCSQCGSALFWRPNSGSHVAILAGSLDDPSVLKAQSHICTDGRPDFYDLCDGLPQYAHTSPDVPIASAAPKP